MTDKFKVAIFASGSGTNAQRLIDTFASHDHVEISCVLSNKADAYALIRAQRADIPTQVFSRTQFYDSEEVIRYLQARDIDLVVLAGFLWLIPASLVEAFPKRIINIHPALLPKYGGKGMYGIRVHEAVWKARETETGITIHYVNEHYDEGEVILQARCEVSPEDTPDSIAAKVHQLEYAHLPAVVAQLAEQVM